MFYVSISSSAIEKVKEHAKLNQEKEVIGLLTGRLENNVLIIEDALTGEIVSEKARASLTPETIAKIADQIVNKKAKGNIVGWYHSHPGFGVFVSDIDMRTQMKLQQFSPYIIALVIDPTKEEIGFFTIDMRTRSPIMISEEHVYIYSEGEEEPIPQKFKQPSPEIIEYGFSPFHPTPVERQEKRPVKKMEVKKTSKRRKLSLVGTSIVTIACILVAGIYISFLLKAQALTITISPESAILFVGYSIEINANISRGTPPYNCTWYLNGNSKSVYTNKTYFSYIFAANCSGNYKLYAKVTDNSGKTGASKNVTIQVLPLWTYLELESPKDNERFYWGDTIFVKGVLLGSKTHLVRLAHKNITLEFTSHRKSISTKEKTVNVTTTYNGSFKFNWSAIVIDNSYPANITLRVTFPENGTYAQSITEIHFQIIKKETSISIIEFSPYAIEGILKDNRTNEGIYLQKVIFEWFNGTVWKDIGSTLTDKYGRYAIKWNSTLYDKAEKVRTRFPGDKLYKEAESENKSLFRNFNWKNFEANRTVVTEGDKIAMSVTIENKGFRIENFNVTLVYSLFGQNNWIRANDTIINLLPSRSFNVTLLWDTSNLSGEYEVKFQISQMTAPFDKQETNKKSVKINPK